MWKINQFWWLTRVELLKSQKYETTKIELLLRKQKGNSRNSWDKFALIASRQINLFKLICLDLISFGDQNNLLFTVTGNNLEADFSVRRVC